MDSQSVKNTDTADSKGYDAGKKVSGIKRHIAVDTQGLPHGIHVTTADVTDRAGALAMFVVLPMGAWTVFRRSDLNQGNVQKVLVAPATGVTPGSPLPLRCKACWEPTVLQKW